MTTNVEPLPLEADAAEAKTAIVRVTEFGEYPATWEQAFKIAKVLAASALIPKHYQGRFEDVVVGMAFGAELNLKPLQALSAGAVVNGKYQLYGDGLLGVVQASPRYIKHVEYYIGATGDEVDSLRTSDFADDETRAVSKFWRRGVAEPFKAEFSIADAKRAKLWTKDGAWQQYPARMLRWRARDYAARDAFADELRGLTVNPDDVVEDVEPLDARPVTAPVRRSEKPPPPTTPSPKPAPGPTRPTPPSPPTQPPPKPSSAPTSADGVVITDTAFVDVSVDNPEPYFEIRATVAKPGAAPIAYKFRTVDKTLYDLAASAEGKPDTFRVLWRNEKAADIAKKDIKVIEELAAD